jgi:hypothetical protein
MTHWNNDPFVFKGGSGFQEYEPAIFRMPYFMMKFYFMEEEKE